MDVKIISMVFLPIIPIIALFFEGLRRKLTARLQDRIGPPIWQPFYDTLKLFQKETAKSRGQSNFFFQLSPILYFITTISLFLFIPLTLISLEFDFILLIYLTILCSGFYTICGIAANSPYTTIGSMREMILMVVYEITLAIVVFTVVLASKTISLAGVQPNLLVTPFAFIAMIAVAITETKITPFDTAEATTEIIESIKTEYSGKNLAVYEMARFMKFTFFAFLIPFLFITRELVPLLIWSVIVVLFLTVTQATTSRFRVDQSFRYLLLFLILALINFIWVLV